MKEAHRDGGVVVYRDEDGNELRVWEDDGRVLGADFKGVEYAVAGAGMHNNYWSKIGSKGRISKEFREWFKWVENQLKNQIATDNLSEY